jgi:hypothetical protein
MNNQSFSLQPFPSSNLLPDFKVEGMITRHTDILVILYLLFDPLAKVVVPLLADKSNRKNDLWKETCFEFFISAQNSGQYWEFNLSPAGHWNVYRFDAYRQGMQEEIAVTSLPFSVQRQKGFLSLLLNFNLNKIIQVNQRVEMGITAVIKHRDNQMTYMALTHKHSQADFHQRDSFIIKL